MRTCRSAVLSTGQDGRPAAREAEVSRTANAAQAQRWNGESGRYWVAHRERHLAGHRYLVPHLFGAAAISAGERVLDVGCGCGATTIAAAQAARGDGRGRAAARLPGGSESGSCRWPGSVRTDAGRRAVAGRAGRRRRTPDSCRATPRSARCAGVLRRNDQQLRRHVLRRPRRRVRAWPPRCAAAAGWPSCAGSTICTTSCSPFRCAPSAPTRGCRARPPGTSSLSRAGSPSCYRVQAGTISRSTRSASRPGWDPTSPT